MMIEAIKNIESEYAGLIPSSVVACDLFDGDEKSAIEYLESLVKNGELKRLNRNHHNQYYRFWNEYEIENGYDDMSLYE